MTSPRLEYQLRIRNQAGTADVLTVTSVRGGTAPYIAAAPAPDGSEFDPLTGAYRSGSCTVRVADAITSGTSRVVTSQLEDATYRQQLTGRSAFVEERVNGGAWTVIQAGIVTALRLASPAVWEIDVGDVTRATRNLLAFAPLRDGTDATLVEPLATYLARWPNRGCIAGGPVIGGFLNRADLGGWTFTVKDRQISETTTYTPSGGGGAVTTTLRVAYLEFVSGYAASVLKDPSLSFARRSRFADVRDQANAALGTITNDGGTTFPRDVESPPLGGWRDVVVQIGSQYFAGINAYAGFGAAHLPDNVLLSDTRDTTGLFVMDSAARLTIGATVTVRIYDALPTDRCPIYFTGHPLDLWTKLCDEAGLAYDASAVATCKAALGSALTINLRITATQSWSSFVEGVLYGPCGFSARVDATGRLVPFATRVTGTALPAVTLTPADVPQDATTLFELTEPDAITRLTVNETNLITNASISSALDGVDVQTVTVLRTSGDAGGPVQREQSYTIPGFLATGGAQYEPGLVDALARNVFDRYGRGRLAGEVVALRGGAGDTITLGQEVLVALPAMPNHNKRYGDDNTVGGRVVQVVRVTQMPDGKHLRFVDSGPNAQPASPLPVVALATGATTGSAGLSITNAATLNAVPIGVRVQWAQTTGAAPAASAYADVAWYDYGKVPTVVSPLPVVTPGLVVWVQARAEQAGYRPSAYSTPVSITVGGLGAPASLTATPSGTDGTRCLLLWTIGTNAGAALSDVFLRLQSAPSSADVRVATVLAGSVGYPLTDLTPGTAYTASVQHRAPGGAVSTVTTVNFTAGATVYALAAPITPVGIVGRTDADGIPRIDGTYGIDVHAVELPGTVEFLEAIETGVGTGVYGTPLSVARIPSVSGAVTSYRNIAPHDRLRRSLTTRHIRTGATTSASTAAIIVDPWGAVQSPAVPGATSFSGLSVSPGAGYSTPAITNQMILSWSVQNQPAGATYNIVVFEQTTNAGAGTTQNIPGVTSPYTYATVNDFISTGARTRTVRFSVECVSGSTVTASSTTVGATFNSNT